MDAERAKNLDREAWKKFYRCKTPRFECNATNCINYGKRRCACARQWVTLGFGGACLYFVDDAAEKHYQSRLFLGENTKPTVEK